MIKYSILCYKDIFKNFKKITATVIPANEQDEFALLVCMSKDGKIGFKSTEESSILLGALAKDNYVLACDGLFLMAKAIPGERRPQVFKPKDESFREMIDEYEKSELHAKKFQVLSRHGRPCPAPEPTILSDFLKDTDRPISTELYQRIIETCHYVTKDMGAGEYGYGAFEVYSDNLDVFFDDLKALMGEAGELVFVDYCMIPYD